MRRKEPQQQRSRHSREAILAAALECFGQHGWRGTSIGMIAARAGVSVGTVYGHFANKHDLLLTVARERLSTVNEMMSLADFAAASEPMPALSSLVENVIRRRREAAGLLLAWSDASQDHEELADAERALRTQFLDVVTAIVEVLARNGNARVGLDPRRMAIAVVGVIESVHRPPWTALDPAAAAAECTRMFYHAIFTDHPAVD